MAKFGLQHPNVTHDGEGRAMPGTLVRRARFAEEHGFDSF